MAGHQWSQRAQPFNIDIFSLMADNSSGDAMNFDALLDHSFTILSYDSLIGDFDSIWFNLVLGSFSNDYDPAHSALVPEPGRKQQQPWCSTTSTK